MAGNCSEGLSDDFFEQILAVPETGVGGYGGGRVGDVGVLQLGPTPLPLPLGLNLEQNGFLRHHHHQDAPPRQFVDNNVVDVEGRNVRNNNHLHHQHQHLRLHDMNNNNTSSSPSSTAVITVCFLPSTFFALFSFTDLYS